MNSIKTGEFISRLRKEKGLTQIALANMLNISNRAVSKWENGDGFPDISILPNLAEALDVTVDELLAGERKNTYKPEAKFINESIITEKLTKSAMRSVSKAGNTKLTVISLGAFLLVASASVWLLDLDNKIFLIAIYLLLYLLLLFFKLLLPSITAKLRINDAKLMGEEELIVRSEFADKIYANTKTSTQEINYNAISDIYETKEIITLRIGAGHYLTLRKDGFILGELDDFIEFIKGKIIPSKRVERAKKLNIVLSVLLLIFTVTLIPLNIILYSIQGDQYQPKRIEATVQYFYDNQTEFERSLQVIQNDDKINKAIKDDGYFCYDSNEYVALNNIYNIEAGEGYITYSTYANDDCFSGYVYYEGENIPYPYQIGFDHADIENYPFNYISEDDLYLLGKTENDKSTVKDWYLIKNIAENWYYYEYY